MIANQTVLKKEILGIQGFFVFWFIKGPFWFWQRCLITLENFEGIFAVRLMLKHIAEPIFQDYSRAGRMIGVLIRLLRIVVGIIFYLAIILIFIFLAIIWLILPFFAVKQVLFGLFF